MSDICFKEKHGTKPLLEGTGCTVCSLPLRHVCMHASIILRPHAFMSDYTQAFVWYTLKCADKLASGIRRLGIKS